MNDVAAVLAWLSGVAIILEGYGLWMNLRDYVIPAMCSVRYRPIVRTRILVFAEPRLRRFFRTRYRSIGPIFFFVPLILSVLFLGRSWQTAMLGATSAAHLAIVWLAWHHLNIIWGVVQTFPSEAMHRFAILQAAQVARWRH